MVRGRGKKRGAHYKLLVWRGVWQVLCVSVRGRGGEGLRSRVVVLPALRLLPRLLFVVYYLLMCVARVEIEVDWCL